jgi:hypothetical protein
MKVGKYSDHFLDDTFVQLAIETYGCLDSAFATGFSARACARGALDGPPSFGREVWDR